MIKVKFYEIGIIKENELKYAVISAKYKDKFIFCRHQERTTWEIPGGRKENKEIIEDAAKRELYEETGAKNFYIKAICDYAVIKNEDKSFGRLFFAEVFELEKLPKLEIIEIKLFDKLPSELTYPEIQTKLHNKIIKEMI